MKRSTLSMLILSIFIITVATMVVTNLSIPEEISANGDQWAEVCCGTKCKGGKDYCTGSGNYVCCKTEPIPIE
jgi:hypothetical protein